MISLAMVIADQALPPVELPNGVYVQEDLAPLPIRVAAVESTGLAALRAIPGVLRVTVPETDELGIVRGIAAVLSRFADLRQRAPNGYAGRLPHDQAGSPAYPIISPDRQYLTTTDPQLLLITAQCHPAVLNLSNSPPSWLARELDLDDPLAVATSIAAAQMPVVVAVGNGGRLLNSDTRSALAKLPWTISVGSTEDPGGKRLNPSSSKGPDGGPGPFVCAFRESIHPRPRRGTSFAASRVSREIAVLTAFLSTLATVIEASGVSGVPLTGIGFVDDAVPPTPQDLLPIPAYPLAAGIDPGRVLETVDAETDPASLTIPEVVLRALVRSARPIPDTTPSQTGHGFVSEDTTLQYLRAFDGHELRHILTPESPSTATEDRRGPAFATEDLERAVAVWRRGALRLVWDYTTNAGVIQ